MIGKYKKRKLLLLLTALSQSLSAAVPTSDTWTGSTSIDLNTPGNWENNIVPTVTAVFDSNYPPANFTPTATSQFRIENFYFPNSASDFQFTINNTRLLITGTGITGINTDTQIDAINTGNIGKGQIFFSTGSSLIPSSIGSASMTLTNTSTGSISSSIDYVENLAQIILCDSDFRMTGPVTASDNATLSLINNGTINGSNEAGQLFLKGNAYNSSFNVGDHFILNATNSGSNARIHSYSDTGQMVFDANNGFLASMKAGDYATFNLNNDSGSTIESGASSSGGNNVGQMVFDGQKGVSSLSLGNHATLNLNNTDDGIIENYISGNDTGQMVFDGNKGIASLIAGDCLKINLISDSDLIPESLISGGGYDTGQMVFDADGGIASFTAGDYATINLTNGNSLIITGSDGYDAGQMLFDGQDGATSFTAGKHASITLNNKRSGVISSVSGQAGQMVFDTNIDDHKGTVSFTIGDCGTVNVTNSGEISTTSCVNIVGQIVFDGGASLPQEVPNGGSSIPIGPCIYTGENVSITATNTATGTITNPGLYLPTQIYFNNTTIIGNPTITAINQNPSANIEGIIFDGLSTADHTNIVLINSSLVVDTTNLLPFSIASLTGNPFSSVELYDDLQINTVNDITSIFSGTMDGVNNLIINGAGTQVLLGVNTFTGSTTIVGGTLILDGSVGGDLIVNGGVLSGSLPGGGAIGGNLEINSGGSYLVEVSGNINLSGTPQSTDLNVAGAITIQGGSLLVASPDGTYSIGRPYTILTSSVLNPGTFSNISIDHPFLIAQPIYNPDPSVQLLLKTNFVSGAITTNQNHVAREIDNLAVPVGNEEVVINTLISLNSAELPRALDLMAGEQYTYLTLVNQISDRGFSRRIFDATRLELDPSCCMPECQEVETWTSLEIGQGFVDGNSSAKSFHQWNADISVGAYSYLNPCVLFGIAANFERSHLSFNLKGNNTLYNGQGSLYVAYKDPSFYVFSDLILGRAHSNFKRSIEFSTLDQTAHSTPKFWHGLWYGECGLNFFACDLLVQPFFGLDVSYVHLSEFSESKAHSLNLHVHGRSFTSPNTYFGAHLAFQQKCFKVNGDLAWQHRFGSLGTKLYSNFIEFGDAFTVNGATYGHDGIIGHLNAAVNLFESFDFYGEVNAEYWSHYYTYSGSIGVSRSW